MTYQCFDVDIENAVAHIRMTRPDKRNSMIPVFWDELPAIVRDIDHNAKARVIVLSSTGPHFTSGLDVGAFFAAAQARQGDERTRRITAGADFYHSVARMQDTFSVMADVRIPVLAAIQGGCIGGGVDLVTACDLRYATEDAYFRVEETNIAMTADVGTLPRLVHLVPDALAREMCFTGVSLDAERAAAAGLVNAVYADHDALVEGVLEIAATIAVKAPLAVHGCKRVINYSRDHSVADTLDYVRLWNASMFQPEQIMEAMAARMEKRPGKFVELPVIRPTVG